MDKYKMRLEFTEPMLGATPKDPDVYAAHIATRAALDDEALAEELASVENMEEKGWTGFHTVDGQPILYDYVIKGFCKDVCGMLRRVTGTKSSKVTAYRKIIDGLVFAKPRQIVIHLPDGQELGTLERPLRAQTAKGERVALARSDTAPAGSWIEFNLLVMGAVPKTLLKEWFDYGALRGLGQWRNAGYGTFTYEMAKQ